MRIAFHVSVLVMDAMRCHPEEWPAFQGQSRAYCQKIFEPLVGLVSAMGEQAVITHADAEAAGDPPQQHSHKKCFPGKHEKRGYGAEVKSHHEKHCELADGFSERAVTLKKFHGC